MVAINRVNGRAPYFHSRGSVRESARKTRAHAYTRACISLKRNSSLYFIGPDDERGAFRMTRRTKDDDEGGRTSHAPVRGQVILRPLVPVHGLYGAAPTCDRAVFRWRDSRHTPSGKKRSGKGIGKMAGLFCSPHRGVHNFQSATSLESRNKFSKLSGRD